MKKLITFLGICTTVAILALPAAARNYIAQPDNAFQDPCPQETKDALYQSFLKNRQADQAKAYEDAKKYLACPAGTEVTEAQQKIIDYLKNFVSKYDAAMKKVSYRVKIYNDPRDYPQVMRWAKRFWPPSLTICKCLSISAPMRTCFRH